MQREDPRSEARERALTILYEAASKAVAPVSVLESQAIATDELVDRLVRGVEAHLVEVDGWISRYSQNWSIERMPVIDVAVLRIALFELAYERDTPLAVVIDEAVNLAKRFSTDDSGRFVNGVLAAAARDLRSDNPS
jgi:N utilization substance protein B